MSSILQPLLDSPSHVLAISDQNKPTHKPLKPRPKLVSYPSLIDFGNCLPGQINETEVALSTEPFGQDLIVLHISCDCINEELEELPQYIFGLSKKDSSSYSNEIRLKAQGEGIVKFSVGLKVPEVPGFIAGIIVVRVLGSSCEPLKILIKAESVIPRISCSKELTFEEMRSIRIMVKRSKTVKKEDRRVSFKNLQITQFSAETEILGLEDSQLVDCSPRVLMIGAQAVFNVMIHIRPTERYKEYMAAQGSNYTIRRILLIKIKDSSVILHFPLEIIFCYSESSAIAE